MADTKTKRNHRATYAADKLKGGWLIRVQGPHAGKFAGKEVPVTMKAGDENTERLTRLIWAGVDKESGDPCALYAFQAKPKDEKSEDDVNF